jgi:organic hydroperoxide reductase OsmC/OhrA
MHLEHHYTVAVEWTGNRGAGTADYKSYGRDHVVSVEGKPDIAGSSDRAFRGDVDRWNPEDLLLAALSQCHMLSYLHEAATNGIVVTAYTDAAEATMEQTNDGGGHFTSAVLRPVVTIAAGDPAVALALHRPAGEKCFIAASVNFPVLHEPRILLADDPL